MDVCMYVLVLADSCIQRTSICFTFLTFYSFKTNIKASQYAPNILAIKRR